MKENFPEIYRQSDLSKFSFSKRILLHAADWMFYLLIKFIGKTLRFEREGWENFGKIEEAGKLPVMTFWHNRIFGATYYFRNRGIVVITSQSFDGEYIARFIKRFGFGAVRGSSTRGGIGALVEMIRLMKKGLPMGLSIDGPRGPKYVAKAGACLLAKKTGNPLLPFLVEAEKYWELKSWDDLQIPKPFSRAKVLVGEPIYVDKNASGEEIEETRVLLQAKLDELVQIGEQWREEVKGRRGEGAKERKRHL